jgi:hypothetical protein
MSVFVIIKILCPIKVTKQLSSVALLIFQSPKVVDRYQLFDENLCHRHNSHYRIHSLVYQPPLKRITLKVAIHHFQRMITRRTLLSRYGVIWLQQQKESHSTWYSVSVDVYFVGVLQLCC